MNATFTLIMQRHNNRSGTNDFICYANDVIHKKKWLYLYSNFTQVFPELDNAEIKNELEY